jgi:hypothetical protein
MTSAWESFHFATLELVRCTPIKQRLISAYRRHLAALALDQLPAEARPSFSQLLRSFSGVQPMRGEDAAQASVRKMSTQEADDCAALIVEIFGLVCRADIGLPRQSAAVVQLRTVECAPVACDSEPPALAATN